MSDLIDRNELFLSVVAQQGVVDKSVMKRLVLQVPTVDAVSVVRCKNCRKQLICYHSDNYFCADGERREE